MSGKAIAIGGRRELFVDEHWLEGLELKDADVYAMRFAAR
jgi:hypothetical protein